MDVLDSTVWCLVHQRNSNNRWRRSIFGCFREYRWAIAVNYQPFGASGKTFYATKCLEVAQEQMIIKSWVSVMIPEEQTAIMQASIRELRQKIYWSSGVYSLRLSVRIHVEQR